MIGKNIQKAECIPVENNHDVLLAAAVSACRLCEVSYFDLSPAARKFVTHYRCYHCKLQPLYKLDTSKPRRLMCRACGSVVSLGRNSKYGKMRKKIAHDLSWLA